MECCASQEETETNLSQTLQTEYERINEHQDTRTGLVHICGAGPSLEDSYTELSGDVLAANAAIPFLLNKGVVPRYAMIWDASPLLVKFAVPNPYITYLLASRCHASVFERLKGCNQIIWHAGGDYDIQKILEDGGIPEPMINGGSAAVTRALYLMFFLGYREFHVHGADSSYRGERTHADANVSDLPTGSLVAEKRMPLCVSKRWFETTPEWAAQVEEFKCIYPSFRQMGGKVVVHGDGLLPHVYQLLSTEENHARIG